ncbi:MAG: hypothetical protein GY795_31320 [Desulfobacterales bacterium]|nr:hypothetical protein [Desulfobacterales bacterium]
MKNDQYFIFSLEEMYYAMALPTVERVLRAVELIPVAKMPESVLGLINVKGKIIPVVNIRKQLGLPDRKMDVDDRIIISQRSEQTIAFIVDEVEGIADQSFKISSEDWHHNISGQIFPQMEKHIEGAGKYKNQTVVIYNIHKLFSVEDLICSE